MSADRAPAPAGAHQRPADRADRRRPRRRGAGAARRHHAAEGGRRRRHHPCRRQARGARGDRRACRTATSRSSRSRPRPRRRCSSPAPIGRSSPRLTGLTWGAEDLSAELGAEANRDADGRFLDPYRLARVLCLAGAAAALGPGDRHGLCRFPQRGRAAARMRGGAARRIHRQDGDPSGAGRRHQRGVHAHAPRRSRARRRSSRRSRRRRAPATVGIGGVMYDRPHLARATQVLARAGEDGGI